MHDGDLIEIRSVERFGFLGIQDRTQIDLTRTVNRGNGRRYRNLPAGRRARTPLNVTIEESPTTHEITLAGGYSHDQTGSIDVVKPDEPESYRRLEELNAQGQFPSVARRPKARFVGPLVHRSGERLMNAYYRRVGKAPLIDTMTESDAYMVHTGAGSDTLGRPRFSKALMLQDGAGGYNFYYVLTWTDLFGAQVREGELSRVTKRKAGDTRVLYTKKSGKAANALLAASVTAFLDCVQPDDMVRNEDTWAAWRTDTVMSLVSRAREGDQNQAIIADALQDAGCDDEAVLNHLRARGIHHSVNCWALNVIDPIEAQVPTP